MRIAKVLAKSRKICSNCASLAAKSGCGIVHVMFFPARWGQGLPIAIVEVCEEMTIL